MQLNIFSSMYIIEVMCDNKSTQELAQTTSGTVSTHRRMTNKNLWIEQVFKGRFLNKSFTGKTKGKPESKKATYQRTGTLIRGSIVLLGLLRSA